MTERTQLDSCVQALSVMIALDGAPIAFDRRRRRSRSRPGAEAHDAHVMRWFRRGPKKPEAPLDPSVEVFARSIRMLTPDQVAEARRRVDASGIGKTHESAFAIGMVVAASMHVGGRRLLNRASDVAMGAVKSLSGVTRADYRVGYVAATAAEAIVVRERIDPETWAFLTEPWQGLADLPAQWIGPEPATVTNARATREAVAEEDRDRRARKV
jgi:hypothetical protein